MSAVADRSVRAREPCVRHYMTSPVVTVDAATSAVEADREFTRKRLGACPVLDHGVLVGVISHSDLVRQNTVAQARAEEISDYYRDLALPAEAYVDEIAAFSGQQLRLARVADLMSTRLFTISPDATLREAARSLLEHRIHRLLVVDEGRLLGLLSSQDLVRAVADGATTAAA